jgi:PAS domain S-box-containing protein
MFYSQYNSVYCNGKNIKLTKKQAVLLKTLLDSKNKVIDAETLYWKIWEDNEYFKTKSLRNLVSDLKKIVPSLNIINYYAEGYLLKISDLNNLTILKDTIDILEQIDNGVCITNPNKEDNPIIYVNKAFTDIFLYTFDEVVGKNCRFLQNDDRNQEGIALIKEAIKNEKPISTILRNYKKNGDLVYSEITISPIFDLNLKKLNFFIGIQKDITKNKDLLIEMNNIFKKIL